MKFTIYNQITGKLFFGKGRISTSKRLIGIFASWEAALNASLSLKVKPHRFFSTLVEIV
jgi:hypothetical protein